MKNITSSPILSLASSPAPLFVSCWINSSLARYGPRSDRSTPASPEFLDLASSVTICSWMKLTISSRVWSTSPSLDFSLSKNNKHIFFNLHALKISLASSHVSKCFTRLSLLPDRHWVSSPIASIRVHHFYSLTVSPPYAHPSHTCDTKQW